MSRRRVLPGTEQHGVGALVSMSISHEDVHNTCHRNAAKLPGL